MHGVSEVIAIILILMITISLAGLAYMFMSTTMSDVTSSAGSTVDTTTSSMLTSFTIESMDIAKVYVRNTGQNALTSLSVYVNNEPAVYNMTPTSVAAGAVGTVTIYSFIPDGATVKITSPNGFSTSKVARPCSKAVGCWDFDEASGTTSYDSSPYGNTGTLMNVPTWTSGRYNGGLLFDGINDYVDIPHSSLLMPNEFSIELFVKPIDVASTIKEIIGKTGAFLIRQYGQGIHWHVYDGADYETHLTSNAFSAGSWFHVVAITNSTHQRLFVDSIEISGSPLAHAYSPSGTSALNIGRWNSGSSYFNGTIDEVRIYDRAIY